MTEPDPVQEFFLAEEAHTKQNAPEEVADYYPGSKIRIDVPKPTRRVNKLKDKWDDSPEVKMINGREVEFFTLNSLARALGRSTDMVRKWVQRGFLPQSPFRSKGYTTKEGKEVPGKRLYTREMVEAVVDKFDSYGLLKVSRMNWENTPTLPREIQEEWVKIHQELTTNQSVQSGSNQ